MPTFKLTIEYEGTRYSGWQTQGNTDKTVQGRLIRAATEAFGECDLGGAGRTDAGVHASGQVAHMRMRRKAQPDEIRRELNDRLPPDIHVLSVARADERFHARHDAASRIYLYQISRRRTAFAKPFVWWVKDRLDFHAISGALPELVGRHDFTRLSDAKAANESKIVVVDSIAAVEAGDLILIRIAASHYLWKMVRKIVAVAVQIGRREMTGEDLRSLLHQRGEPFRPTAPPSGLFLEAVTYPGEEWTRPLLPLVPVTTDLPERE